MSPRIISILTGVAAGFAAILIVTQWVWPWASDPTRGVPGFDPDIRPAAGVVGAASCLHCHEQHAPHHGMVGVTFQPSLPNVEGLTQKGERSQICKDDQCLDVMYAVGEADGRRKFLLRTAEGGWVAFGRELEGDAWVDPDNHYPPEGSQHPLGRGIASNNVQRCLSCHMTLRRGEGLPAFSSQVDCESCHYNGWRHIKSLAKADGSVPPKLGPHGEGETGWVRTCGRCHGDLEHVPARNLLLDPDSVAAYPAAGLRLSACNQQGMKGKESLHCGRCHDTHGAGPVTREQTQEVCESCHGVGRAGTKVTCIKAPNGDCGSCHLPSAKLADGSERTDHWIRLRGHDPTAQDVVTDANVMRRTRTVSDAFGKMVRFPQEDPRVSGLVWMKTGVLRTLIGDSKGSVEALEESIRLMPDEPHAHYNLGNALMGSGASKNDRALKAFKQALYLAPDHLMARIRMAELYRRTGHDEDAAEHLREAIRVAPDNAVALRQLAKVVLVSSGPADALPLLERAVKADPLHTRARRDYAVLLHAVGRKAEALEEWKKVSAALPELLEAAAAVDVLSRSQKTGRGGTP